MRYNALMTENYGLQQQAQELAQQTNVLNEQTQQLSQQNEQLEQINRRNGVVAGVTEVAAGALWFAIEPISGAVAIMDGLQRIYWGRSSNTPN